MGRKVAAGAWLSSHTLAGVLYVQRGAGGLLIVTLSVPRQAPLFGATAPEWAITEGFGDYVVGKDMP